MLMSQTPNPNLEDEWHADPEVLNESFKQDAKRWEEGYTKRNATSVRNKVLEMSNGQLPKKQAQERVKP